MAEEEALLVYSALEDVTLAVRNVNLGQLGSAEAAPNAGGGQVKDNEAVAGGGPVPTAAKSAVRTKSKATEQQQVNRN